MISRSKYQKSLKVDNQNVGFVLALEKSDDEILVFNFFPYLLEKKNIDSSFETLMMIEDRLESSFEKGQEKNWNILNAL